MKNKITVSLITYFVIAFGLTWLSQFIALSLVSSTQVQFSNVSNFLMIGRLLNGELDSRTSLALIIFTFSFGPALAGIVCSVLFFGFGDLKQMLRKLFKVRLEMRWYIAVFLIPILMNLISLAIGFLLSGFSLGNYNPLLDISYLPLFLVYMYVFTGISEEIGWRGFALEKLQLKFDATRSSKILGVFWGIWHVPIMIYFNLSQPHVIFGSVVGVILGTVGWSIVNTWFYNNTKSLFLMSLLHGWGNTAQIFLLLSFNNLPAQFFFGFSPWLIVFVLVKYYKKEDLMTRVQN